MVGLAIPYENRMEEAHFYKREIPEHDERVSRIAGYKAEDMLVQVGARVQRVITTTTFL